MQVLLSFVIYEYLDKNVISQTAYVSTSTFRLGLSLRR